MIKFFRKIRQKLLSENKFRHYLFYAIGEIVLVVIGILIALQINNFNNGIQERKIEQAYLVSLKSEFETNLSRINNSLEENSERVKAAEDLLALFDHSIRDTISDAAISTTMYSVFASEATYNSSNGVITDLISSGNLNLIQNKELRQGLASFESKLDYLRLIQTAIRSMKIELKNQLDKHGSIRQILVDKGLGFEYNSISDSMNNRQLFTEVEFENSLLDYYLTIKSANGSKSFGGMKEQIEQILDDLDSEIKH